MIKMSKGRSKNMSYIIRKKERKDCKLKHIVFRGCLENTIHSITAPFVYTSPNPNFSLNFCNRFRFTVKITTFNTVLYRGRSISGDFK